MGARNEHFKQAPHTVMFLIQHGDGCTNFPHTTFSEQVISWLDSLKEKTFIYFLENTLMILIVILTCLPYVNAVLTIIYIYYYT